MTAKESFLDTLTQESDIVRSLTKSMDMESMQEVMEMLMNCKGVIGVAGCGTSGAAATKIVHTLSCVQCTAMFMSPANANHGQMGAIREGDIVILISAFLLGPLQAAFAAGFGSAAADLLLGYSAYAPGTLLVKGLAGLTAGALFVVMKKRTGLFLSSMISGVAGELVMVAGYFGFETLALQSAAAAAAGVVPNILQGIAGVLGALVMMPAMNRILPIGWKINSQQG